MALTFLGGIELYEYRNTSGKPFVSAAVPEYVKFQVKSGYTVTVSVGDPVKINTKLMTDSEGFPCYCSVSGCVSEITDELITVKNDGKDERDELFPHIDKHIADITADEFFDYLKVCGLVGSYSGIPVYKKLSACVGKVKRLVVSCIESDPSSGHVRSFAAQNAEAIILGAKIVLFMMGIKKAIFAFREKDSKVAAAFHKLKGVQKDMISSAFVGNKYPQGNERLLVTSVYNVEIPFSTTPEQCGYLVMSAETLYNVYNCLVNSSSVYEKAITLAGEGVKPARNIIARVGTPFSDILPEFNANERAIAVSGGVVNGIVDEGGFVGQSTNMLVAALPHRRRVKDCIRCSQCASVCPMHLVPFKFVENHSSGFRDKNIENGLFNCIECGCCSYTCPSGIDILTYIRNDKNNVFGDNACLSEASDDTKPDASLCESDDGSNAPACQPVDDTFGADSYEEGIDDAAYVEPLDDDTDSVADSVTDDAAFDNNDDSDNAEINENDRDNGDDLISVDITEPKSVAPKKLVDVKQLENELEKMFKNNHGGETGENDNR